MMSRGARTAFQDFPDRLGVLPQPRVLFDARGCLAGRGEIALVQLLGLAVYPVHGRGGCLEVVGQDDRARWQRRLPGLQRLLLRGRGGRLAFERVGFGLEPAQLISPRCCRCLQRLRGAGGAPQRGRERALDSPQRVGGPPLQGVQVQSLDEGERLPCLLRDQGVLPREVPGQADIAGGRIEAQGGQGAGVGVQRAAPAAWLSC